MRRYLLNEKGQALIEMMVVLAVVVIVILALVQITTVSIRNATFAKNRALATKYAQEWMEEARKLRDEQADNVFFVDGSCTITPPQSVGIFTKERVCSYDAGEEVMTAVVTVEWTDGSGTHQSRLETHLTNWK